MVFIERKKKKGHVYLYLTHKARINGKSKRVWTMYLGPEERILEHAEQIKKSLGLDFEVEMYDYGGPMVLMKLASRLDLINIIDQYVEKRQQGISVGEYMLIAILNRCIKPISKNRIKKWFYSTYLQNSFPRLETYLDSMAYTNHYHYLTRSAIEKIEKKIIEKLKTEFEVNMDEIMYDPTNFATYINPEKQKLPRHGHSKEGKHILNLVSLSIFCTRDGGIPIMHQVYPGNVQDAAQFKKDFPRFLTRLRELNISTSNITLVFDKGNISPEVFEEIDSSNIHWIASVRPSSHKDLQAVAPEEFRMVILPNKKEIGVKEFQRELHGSKRRLIVIYNPNRARWAEKSLRKKLETKLEKVHEWFKDRLNERKWREPKAVEEKIRDIIKYKSHLRFFSYEITGKYNKVRYSIKINEDVLKKHIKTLGKSFLMSNHTPRTMNPEEVVWLYRQQYTVERAFKYLKNYETLKIKPMYVWKDECIRGHVFTCVISLILLMLLQREVNTKFPQMSLFYILELLSEIRVAEIKFSGSDRIKRKMVKISPEAKKLADFFNLQASL